MSFDDLIGRFATLAIRRFSPSGAFLAEITAHPGPEDPTILLIGTEIPKDAKEGDSVPVFLYLDSEGRPLATTRTPKVALGDVAFLEVTACTEFGAFADFGLPKELLVPFPEHTTKLFPGAWHPIGLYRDASGRLAGTMRVSKLLDQADPGYERDQWVMGETWRNDPDIGLFVILDRRYVGLVPAGEPHTLGRGEAARFRVTALLPDGKIELSLRGHAHEELGKDAERILEAIARMPEGKFSERAGPEEIRTEFGVSRKAFKRAVGRLLREGKVTIDGEGVIGVVGSDTPKKH